MVMSVPEASNAPEDYSHTHFSSPHAVMMR